MANLRDFLSSFGHRRRMGHAGAITVVAIVVIVVVIAVASLATAGLVLHRGNAAAPNPASHKRLTAAVRKSALVRKPAAPKTAARQTPAPAPSAFDKEQAMSFRQRMNRWNPFIAQAAKKYAVPQTWIRAVMQAESGGRTMLGENKPITSTAGAMGLMQLMPQTYEDMRRQYGLGHDPYDPHDNIMAGAAYLRFLRSKYPYPAMFAAYNDGPGNLEARLISGGLLPMETQLYVGHITSMLENVSGGRGDARFTRPNGEAVMLNAAAVASVRAAFPGEYAPGVQSVITIGRLHQGVRESVAQAKAIIRAHGGGI